MDLSVILLLLLLGLVTGFYSGLVGTGGNIILIPALDVLFSYYRIDELEMVKLIIAHSLFITMFLGAIISYRQHRIGNFYGRAVLNIGLPGTIVAYLLSESIQHGNWYDKSYFDVFFLALLVLLAYRMLFVRAKVSYRTKETEGKQYSIKPQLIFLGLFTGAITSLSGLGGGVVLIPFLTDISKRSIQQAGSISIGVITLLATAVSISYLFGSPEIGSSHVLPYQTGYISILLVIPILLGILLSSSYGVMAAQRTSQQRLRLIFGLIVCMICVKMIFSILG